MPTDDELYEAYLAACERGEAAEPAAFLAEHGCDDAELRQRLEVLFRFAGTEPLPFERLGPYRLVRRLDRGGMGEVYVARTGDTTVALKVLRPELRGAATALERFRREGAALAQLDHPNIVRVHDAGEAEGVLYIAMDLVKGRTLDAVLEEGAIATTDVVRWARDIARALHHAHALGIVHRDVKPSNILIRDDGRPYLLDFGVARGTETLGPTVTRAFAGSPLYAAPEQLRGRKVDGRADLYGLGVTLYQAVTGTIPFEDVSGDRLYVHVMRHEPTPPRELNPALPPRLELVLGKALAKDPEARYGTGDAFARDLQALLDLRPVSARPPSVWMRAKRWRRRRPKTAALLIGAAALLLLAVGLAGYRSWAQRREADDTVAAAQRLLHDFREQRRTALRTEERIAELQDRMIVRYLTDEEHAFLNEQERAIDRARRDRERTFHEILNLVRRAERLGAEPAELDRLRLELYLERRDEARTARDPAAMEFFSKLADDLAPELARARRSSSIIFAVEPPDARLHVFRIEVDAAEPRHVAQPFRGQPPVPPGTWALRVMADRGALRRDDLIVEIDGHAVRALHDVASRRPEMLDAAGLARRGGTRAVACRNGRLLEVTVPPGLDVRTTARPLFVSDACRVRPGERVLLREGHYLAVARREGFEELRRGIQVKIGGADLRLDLELAEGTTPAGFVPIRSKELPPYWIMEREVTAAEYMEFLNDPEVLAVPGRALVPRGGGKDYWRERADGTFEMDPDWRPDWPVLGVSWHDAQRYAAWRNKRAPAGRRYALPTHDQWLRAMTTGEFFYPFGPRFRSRWINSCYSRPKPAPEPVLRYPIDESVYGVYDMCGSASEWLAGWYDVEQKLRRVAGGSWARSKPADFTAYPSGRAPGQATGEMGFRLVLVTE